MESNNTDRPRRLAEEHTSSELSKMLWKARVKFLSIVLIAAVPAALIVGFFAHTAFSWLELPFNVSMPIVLVLAILSPAILIATLSVCLRSGREADDFAEALSVRFFRELFEDRCREGN